MKLTIPTIHMNGTSAESLKEDLETAFVALKDAYVALRRTAPNGRDYYVDPNPDALKNATGDHMDRLRRVDEIADELVAICEGIDAQVKK